jgi:hypothetical protein
MAKGEKCDGERREEPREVVRKPKPRKSEMHNAGN